MLIMVHVPTEDEDNICEEARHRELNLVTETIVRDGLKLLSFKTSSKIRIRAFSMWCTDRGFKNHAQGL